MTLSCVTTPGQSGPGSDGNKGVVRIPQSSCITGTSPSDCLMLYPVYSMGESYTSAEVQLVYSTATADKASFSLRLLNEKFIKSLFTFFLKFRWNNEYFLHMSICTYTYPISLLFSLSLSLTHTHNHFLTYTHTHRLIQTHTQNGNNKNAHIQKKQNPTHWNSYLYI